MTKLSCVDLPLRRGVSCATVGWFKRKFTLEEVRAEIDRSVKEAVAAVEQKYKTDSTISLTQAVAELYTKQLEGFGKTASVFNDILQGAGDLAVRQYARVLGSRGGRKKQENLELRRATVKRADVFDANCIACLDPHTTNSSAISRHVMENHVAKLRLSQNAQPQLPLNGSATGAQVRTGGPKTSELN